jgi:hypothetical protein
LDISRPPKVAYSIAQASGLGYWNQVPRPERPTSLIPHIAFIIGYQVAFQKTAILFLVLNNRWIRRLARDCGIWVNGSQAFSPLKFFSH